VALLVSLTWERGASYDDGALGTAAFAILYTLGLPVMLPMQWVAKLGLGTSWGLVWVVGVVCGVVFYLSLDYLTVRWRRKHHPDATA
jgi:hypothetical protein